MKFLQQQRSGFQKGRALSAMELTSLRLLSGEPPSFDVEYGEPCVTHLVARNSSLSNGLSFSCWIVPAMKPTLAALSAPPSSSAVSVSMPIWYRG